MTLAPLLNASLAIQFHAFAGLAAVALGVLQFVAPKGTIPHRTVGWIWAVLMVSMLASGFFINDVKAWGPFSPNVCYLASNSHFLNVRCASIHMFTMYFALVIPYAVLHARNHDMKRHRRMMTWLMFGALTVAGLFTLDKARIMNAVVTGSQAEGSILHTMELSKAYAQGDNAENWRTLEQLKSGNASDSQAIAEAFRFVQHLQQVAHLVSHGRIRLTVLSENLICDIATIRKEFAATQFAPFIPDIIVFAKPAEVTCGPRMREPQQSG